MIHLLGEDKKRAAGYYRHSAEDKQENSNEIQREQTTKFADKVNVEIVEHIDDEGFTGLNANRPGFKYMLQKYVIDENAPKIDYILVYDASRFGRFQKMSQVWHYLGMCEEKGIRLATVERGLPSGEITIMDTFQLTLDFTNSADFSRRLSEKVFYGGVKVSEQGYSAGGMAPYGYSRILLNEARKPIGLLKRGERKMISNQRVTFEPAANGEPKVVKRIFREFVDSGRFPDEIAGRLNTDKIPTAMSKRWDAGKVVCILRNETYSGVRVYNKTQSRLASKVKSNPRSEWVRRPNAHKALVSPEVYQMARERLRYVRPKIDRKSLRWFREAQNYVRQFVDKEIEAYSDDQKFFIKQNFPGVFGTFYDLGDSRRSCFYIPPHIRKFPKVLGFSVDTATENRGLRSVYAIDISTLDRTGYLLVEERSRVSLDLEEVKREVSEICRNLLDSVPWLSEPVSVTALVS